MRAIPERNVTNYLSAKGTMLVLRYGTVHASLAISTIVRDDKGVRALVGLARLIGPALPTLVFVCVACPLRAFAALVTSDAMRAYGVSGIAAGAGIGGDMRYARVCVCN